MDAFSNLCALVLLIGLVYSIVKRHSLISLIYLGSILIIEIIAAYGNVNLFLFSISYYIHLFFLSYYILIHFLRWKKNNFALISFLFLIPMILSLIFNTEITSYQSYDRLFYIFSIIILLITTLFRFFDGKLILSNTTITMLLIILFYFSIDFIIALTTNYLINEHLNLVGWIWLFRAFCLLVFYITLVNLVWKTGKTL